LTSKEKQIKKQFNSFFKQNNLKKSELFLDEKNCIEK